jgi:hypothetical protein
MENLFLRGCFSSPTIWPIRGDVKNKWHRIALSVIGCIDYLAYGTILTCAMFLPKIKLDVFLPARKAVDACREVVSSKSTFFRGFSVFRRPRRDGFAY